MQYWEGLANVPANQPRSVVTLGNFDGLHKGHLAVLNQLRETSTTQGLVSVVVTFDPHPRLVHRPEEPLVPIMSLPQKAAELEALGVDATVVVHYTLDFAAQTPEEFVKKTFVDALNAAVLVVGTDTRFGAGNTGDVATLRELGEKYDFTVVEVDDVGTDRRWSSTWVRECLEQGRVAAAAEVLGRNHRVSGTIVHGYARGRDLGYPTANLAAETQGMIPADGVYAGWFYDEHNHRWPTAISVGSNPTFDAVQRTVEAFVMGRPEEEKIEDFDLYGQFCTVEFVARLRGMTEFSGIEALVKQMGQDVAQAEAILLGDAPIQDATDPTPDTTDPVRDAEEPSELS